MRFILLCLALAAPLAPLCAVSQDELNTITVRDNLGAGKTIDYLFYAPDDSDYWGPDILAGQDGIAAGAVRDFQVFYPEASASFSFLAVDGDGYLYEKKHVAVKDGAPASIAFTDAEKTGKKLEGLNMSEIVVSNQTGGQLDYLFLAPADSKIWGIELLGKDSGLESGGTIRLVVLLAGEKFALDCLAVDADGTNYSKNVALGTEEDSYYLNLSADDVDQANDGQSDAADGDYADAPDEDGAGD